MGTADHIMQNVQKTKLGKNREFEKKKKQQQP